jgi:hypothetical protein
MFHLLVVAAVLALGFGLGRVHHPANLKLSAVKAEIAKIEQEAQVVVIADEAKVKALVNGITARVKALL